MLVATVVVLSSVGAWADPAADARAVFERDVDAHVRLVERQMERADRVAQTVGAQQTGTRAKPLDDENVATLSKLAALAIKTDLKGTEAGVAIAPLVLLGRTDDLARGLGLTLAALKDDKLRIGLSYEQPVTARAVGPRALGFTPCEFDVEDYGKRVRARADDFAAVCAAIALVKASFDEPGLEVKWLRAAGSCGREVPASVSTVAVLLPSGQTVQGGAVVDASRKANLTAKISAVLQFWNDIQATIAPAAAAAVPPTAVAQLAAFREGTPQNWSCIENGAIPAAATRLQWDRRDLAAGFSITADFHPYKFGLNPDASDDPTKNKELPTGQLARLETRFELRHSYRRLTWTAGVGGKWEREELDDDLKVSVRPAVGLQFVVMRLDGARLLAADGSVALTDDGQLPPVFVLGVDGLVGVTVHNKPDSQSSRFDEVKLKLFADFRINKDIAFRIGVPLTAEIATRKADAAAGVAEKKALQWTIPVFLATVLEI